MTAETTKLRNIRQNRFPVNLAAILSFQARAPEPEIAEHRRPHQRTVLPWDASRALPKVQAKIIVTSPEGVETRCVDLAEAARICGMKCPQSVTRMIQMGMTNKGGFSARRVQR